MARLKLAYYDGHHGPEDVHDVAVQLKVRQCVDALMTVRTYEVYTAVGNGLFAHSVEPFHTMVEVRFPSGLAKLGIAGKAVHTANHTRYQQPERDGSAVTFFAPKANVAQWRWSEIELFGNGTWYVRGPAGVASGYNAKCSTVSHQSGPGAWLAELLP